MFNRHPAHEIPDAASKNALARKRIERWCLDTGQAIAIVMVKRLRAARYAHHRILFIGPTAIIMQCL